MLTIFKVLANPTRGPVHLELFRPFALEVLDVAYFLEDCSFLNMLQTEAFSPSFSSPTFCSWVFTF